MQQGQPPPALEDRRLRAAWRHGIGPWRSRGRAVLLVLLLAVAACGGGGDGEADDIPSCQTGAADVMAFLQRTLDDIGDADPAELVAYADRFDAGVDGLLQRAQEMHCTEDGFNDAVMARASELKPNGPVGQALIDRVAEIGLGSLDEARGGPLTLPTR